SLGFDQTVVQSLCAMLVDRIPLQSGLQVNPSLGEQFEFEDRLRARKHRHHRFHTALPAHAAWVARQLLRSNPCAMTLSRSGLPKNCPHRETDKARASESPWE